MTKVASIYNGGQVLEASAHSTVTYPCEPVSFSFLLYTWSLCLHHPDPSHYRGLRCRVLDGSAHLKASARYFSRLLYTLSLCANPLRMNQSL
jgi:hypothetical protein